jgi:hypothetical protein
VKDSPEGAKGRARVSLSMVGNGGEGGESTAAEAHFCPHQIPHHEVSGESLLHTGFSTSDLNKMGCFGGEKSQDKGFCDRTTDKSRFLTTYGAGDTDSIALWLASLDLDHPPGDVPVPAWRRFIDNARVLIADWLPQAEALGWTQLELLGCHPIKPHARVDCAGLAWFVGDGRLVALTADSAAIQTASGSRLTFRRRAACDLVVMPGAPVAPAVAAE